MTINPLKGPLVNVNIFRAYTSCFVFVATLLFVVTDVTAATLREADNLYRTGNYRESIEAYSNLEGSSEAQSAVGISRIQLLQGKYELAEETCRDVVDDKARLYRQHSLVAVQLAEVLFATGRSDEALKVLKVVVDSTDVPLRALVKYAEYLRYGGETEEAELYLATALASYNSRTQVGVDELGNIARAHWLLGNFQEANQFYRQAITQDNSNIDIKSQWADLLAEKYNSAEAQVTYQEVLEINSNFVPALVGMAKLTSSTELLEQALFTNPKSVDVFVVFASIATMRNKWSEAQNYLSSAAVINPKSLDVITAQAAIAILTEDAERYEALEQQALAIRPVNAEFYSDIADAFGNDYRFTEAVEFARKAIVVEPEYWPAYTLLGMNLIRLGEEEEGKEVLEKAFDNDSYNVWTNNMLKVFDTLDTYVSLESEHFIVKMNERDAIVLWPYLSKLLEEAWETLVVKYEFEPEGPILIEVFENSEDFAVRSVGLPDIGPLVGICFGKVITLISPDTLTANWQEIVWHEFAHIVTLQMTQNRIPRWLSEGISVYEEHQGHEEWGQRQDLDLVRAVSQDKLFPVENVNDAFLTAQSTEDLSFAYLQSYLVVEFIASHHGFNKLKELVSAYDQVKNDDEIFTQVFQQSMFQFNSVFQNWIAERVAAIDVYVHTEDSSDSGEGHGHGVRNNNSAVLAELYSGQSIKDHMRSRVEEEPRDFQAHLQLGIVLFKEENYEEAEQHLIAAKSILPQYTGYPSPPLVLSQIYQETDQQQKYLEELEFIVKYHQHDIESNLVLAQEAVTKDNYSKAAYHLERAIAVDPYQLSIHQAYADLATVQEQHNIAIQEHRILSELDKTDPVQSYTNLARAYLNNDEHAAAKQNSLLALEIAPTYQPAQSILLEAIEQAE